MSIPSLIGVAMTILASSSLLLNLFVLFIIWRGGLLRSSGSSIYLLAFTNITSNCIQASLIAFYLGPSVILQMDLFPDGPKGIENRIFSYIELASWYTDMQVSAVIAINRVAVIVFSTNFGRLFTRKVVKILSFGLFVTGLLLALVSHILVPCCVPLFHYPSYWEEFLDEGYPYNDYIIDIPQNTISSTISIVCYTIVFFYIRKIYKKTDPNLTCTAAEVRGRKEVRYALQFGALSAFALFAWVGHRIFPRILPDDVIPMVTFSIIIHGTMNSIIFLTINKEVKKYARLCFKNVSISTILVRNMSLKLVQRPVVH